MTGPTSAVPRAEAKAYDPPKAFAAEGVVLPTLTKKSLEASVLQGTTVYTTTVAGVQALDTVTAQVSKVFAPEGLPPATGSSGFLQGLMAAGAPVLVQVGGRELVVAPFVVTIPRRAMS